jgi:transcriptional regulator with XRE-family HTH domain
MADMNLDKKERILQIMKSEGLTPSKFAELIGIGRASMSHIINGRNKPSDAVLTKILERFATINPDWLILGIGNMRRETASNQGITPKEPDLFASSKVFNFRHEDKKVSEFYPRTEDKKTPIPSNPSVEPVFKERSEKKVIRIMIFYSDSTYEVFNPERKANS